MLAGEWDYRRWRGRHLTLDEQGNGTYPWKDGRFETHSLSDLLGTGCGFRKTTTEREALPCSCLRISRGEKAVVVHEN